MNLQLSGQVDTRDQQIAELEEENATLSTRVRQLESDLSRTRRDNQRAISNLRQILSPLRGAINAIWGEMDAISTEEVAPDAPKVGPRKAQVWESWKQKFGGGTAKVIEALLLHGEVNTVQLSIATGLHRTTIPALIFKLNAASLINKNSGRFSLREL